MTPERFSPTSISIRTGTAYVLRGKDLLGLRHLAGRIDAEGDRYAARGQRGDAPQLLLADDLIGDKDILQAVFRQDLRLAGLCSSDAAGACCSCSLAMAGILCVLVCGRSCTP